MQAIGRAAAVLRSLKQRPEGLNLEEIAAIAKLTISAVRRLVDSLVDERLLMPASRRNRVKLGPALMKLAVAADIDVASLVLPLMRDLSRFTEETIDLSTLKGDMAVFVAQVQGLQRLVAVSVVGQTVPLHCTACGKSLLSLLPPTRREQLLRGRLERHTDGTITDHVALKAVICTVADSRLAYDHEEHNEGICGVGVGFTDPLGREYSISIPVPAARFWAKQHQLSQLLIKVQREINARWSHAPH